MRAERLGHPHDHQQPRGDGEQERAHRLISKAVPDVGSIAPRINESCSPKRAQVSARILDRGRGLLGELFYGLFPWPRRSSSSSRLGLDAAWPIRADWVYRASLKTRWSEGIGA
jgi:hypothetical protein